MRMTLETKVLGIDFPNPFLLASGPPTANGAMIVTAFKAGWGGAVTKTIGLTPTRLPDPRLKVIKDVRNLRGMINIELITDLTLEEWETELDLIREAFPDRPVIASIMGGGDPYEWQEVVRRLEPHGVNAFEMNVSCPNFAGGRGSHLGQDPECLASAIRWVKDVTKLPVIVKLTPNVTDIVALARVVKETGGDAITATNTLSGLAGIDLDSLAPLPTVGGIGVFGGYSGPSIKPVSLRCAASIAQAVKIPVLGCGGIDTWKDAAEYHAVGASLVQICTAVMWKGAGIIDDFNAGLQRYLASHAFESVAALCGKALPQLVNYSKVDTGIILVARVDPPLCIGCGICVNGCASGGYQAIELVDKVAVIDPDLCDGCGLCIGLCPTSAISLLAESER
jgi:dihydropyrimidine dehydrogenase (NAD+) subunit PreA